MTTETPAPHDGDEAQAAADWLAARVAFADAELAKPDAADEDFPPTHIGGPIRFRPVIGDFRPYGTAEVHVNQVRALLTERADFREQLAAAKLPSITDGITDAEAEASGTFDLTIDEVRSNHRYLEVIDENARLRRELAAANGRAETAETRVAHLDKAREAAVREWKREHDAADTLQTENAELRARLDGLGEHKPAVTLHAIRRDGRTIHGGAQWCTEVAASLGCEHVVADTCGHRSGWRPADAVKATAPDATATPQGPQGADT